jgi:RNA polymerase sigma-70 factor (ECF subfamily)
VADDAQLLRQIQSGSHDAFAELVQRHGQYLFGVAHALVANSADAEDLVQETLAATLDGGFRGESSVRTWLVKIVVRRAAMMRRSRSRRGSHATLTDSISSAAGSERSSQVDRVEAKMDLTTMLQSLAPDHRAVLVLRELEGLSYQEMADALDVPRGTVESRLHRARQELREKFKGYFS